MIGMARGVRAAMMTLAVLVAMVGCGGGDDESSSPAPGPGGQVSVPGGLNGENPDESPASSLPDVGPSPSSSTVTEPGVDDVHDHTESGVVEDELVDDWVYEAPPGDGDVAGFFENRRGDTPVAAHWRELWSRSVSTSDAVEVFARYLASGSDLDPAIAVAVADRAVDFVEAMESGAGREAFPEYFEPGSPGTGATAAILGFGAATSDLAPGMVAGFVMYQPVLPNGQPASDRLLAEVTMDPSKSHSVTRFEFVPQTL